MASAASVVYRSVSTLLAPHRQGGRLVRRTAHPNLAIVLADPVLTFGPFQLNPAGRLLLRDGKAVRLGSRALDLLTVLAERAGELVSKEEVIARVWPGIFVDDANLRVHIATLRKILGDGVDGQRFITTVAGRGYCFVAGIDRAPPAGPVAGASSQASGSEAQHNLPASLTRMIGRDDIVGLIAAQLPRRRFVTIIGPGGIGKTTVALAVAGNLVGAYPHGVRFIDLGPLGDARLVPSAFASALGVAVKQDDALPGLLAYFRGKSILLVLDNCEHVIEPAAALAEGILGGAPGVHLLATSREPFRAEGEWLHRLATLAVPPASALLPSAAALAFPAVELFAERASAALDNFELTDASVATVCAICRRLDGIPLAIELAAARIALFGLDELAARLTDCFALLTAGRRTALPRHRTLRATLDWSHGLLSRAEQIVFSRLAPMTGAFSMEAAAALAADAAIPAAEVTEVMAGLVGKSLVTTGTGGKAFRYRLFETTRAYAAEKLAQSGDAATVAWRHAVYCRDLMRRGEAESRTLSRADWLATYGGGIDDVRAAIDWASTPDGDPSIGLDLTAVSAPLWFHLSLMGEYGERTTRALARLLETSDPDPVLEMRLQAALGYATWYSTNDADIMQAAFARVLELSERLGDTVFQLQALWGSWAVRRARGEYRAALALATRYADLAARAGDVVSVMLGERILGLTNHFVGNQDVARRQMEHVRDQARRGARELNTDFQLGPEIAAAAVLSRVLWLQGFPDQAIATAREAIDTAEREGHWFSICYLLSVAGCPLALWTGDLALVRQWVGVMIDRAAGYARMDTWSRCYGFILRLRQGGERDRLIASAIETRMDISGLAAVAALAAATAIPMPSPGAESAEAIWNLPEVLRVDAELLLWHDAPGAGDLAEAKLLRSLDVARAQCALSWELRAATSLARLRHRAGRAAAARDLLAATFDRFTEGFDTGDLVAARQLIAEWS